MKNIEYYTGVRTNLIKLIPDGPNKILDIGCGRGDLLLKLKELRKAQNIFGIDIEKFDTKLDKFIAGDIDKIELPFSYNYFDVIICADVLEHLVDPWETLNKIYKYVKPDGIVIISIPNIRELYAISQILFKGDFRYTHDGVLDKTHLRFFCKKNIIELINQSKLDIESCNVFLKHKRKVFNILTFKLFENLLAKQYVFVTKKNQIH